jgi:hypothetical protein
MAEKITEKIKLSIARLIDAGAHQNVEGVAEIIVKQFGLSDRLVNYTHIEIRNKLNELAFKKVPFTERILFLPHCLRNSKSCKATYDSEGLHCKKCGACNIKSLIELAEGLGYRRVFVVPGGSMILKIVKNYSPKAIVGVACNDEINLALSKMRGVNTPGQAVLLLRDGCTDTAVNIDEVKEKLELFEKK